MLLCALVLPEADSARALAATTLGALPQWFAELPTAAVIEVLVDAPAPDNPLEAAPDEGSRRLLASALHVSSEIGEISGGEREVSPDAVRNALRTLQERFLERRGRQLRAEMAEASRKADGEGLLRLAPQKMELDRERRGLDQSAA